MQCHRSAPPLGFLPATCALFMAALGAVLILLAPAQAGCLSSVETVVSEGMSSIVNGDIPSARDKAVIDARVKAVETACGVKVESQAILAQERLVEHTVVNRTSGFVRSYELLKEWQEGPLYHVEINALVSGDLKDEEAVRYYRHYNTITWLEETVDGKQSAAAPASRWLYSLLKNEGYEVEDPARLAKLSGGARLVNSAINGEPAAIKSLGGRFLARLLVVGTVDSVYSGETKAPTYEAFGSGAKICYRAKLNIKVIDTGSQKDILSYSSRVSGIKGYGQSKETASANAVQEGLSDFKKKLMPALAAYTGNAERKITILAENISDKDSYDRLKAMITDCRWVTMKSGSEFRAGGSAKFVITYPESTYVLASSLEQKDLSLKIKKFGWDNLAVRWEKRP